MNKFLHTFQALAERLAVSRNTVDDLVDAGHLEIVFVGRRRLISESSLQAFIAKHSGITSAA